MSKLTFSKFMSIMENGEQDVAKITGEIAAIDAELAQKSAPLLARKMQLSKLLQQKQQQAQASAKSGQQTGMISNTTTPGSAGAATPGGGTPGM